MTDIVKRLSDWGPTAGSRGYLERLHVVAITEIVNLRADVAVERALADQLAEALRWFHVGDCAGPWIDQAVNGTRAAIAERLAAYDRARNPETQ